MKIMDNNALSYISENSIRLHHIYFVTPDVQEEFEVQFDKLPSKVTNIVDTTDFDGALYLKMYQDVLNLRHNRSFYNMKGFGDISILALLMTLKAVLLKDPVFLIDEHLIITSDGRLTKDIQEYFNNPLDEFDKSVRVEKFETYTW